MSSLLRVPDIRAAAELVLLPACMEITSAEMSAFVKCVDETDLIIYQPVSPSHRGEEFSTARIIESVTSAQFISFTYYHFELYTPFVSAPFHGTRGFANRYVDYLLSAALACRMKREKIVDLLLNFEGLEAYAPGMQSAALYSLRDREMRVLDGDRPMDVTIADRVEANYRSRRLGHTINHPSCSCLGWIVNDVAALIRRIFDMDDVDHQCQDIDPLNHTEFFAAPFVRQAFGLSFHELYLYKFENRYLNIHNYVDFQREDYEAIDRQSLTNYLEFMAKPDNRPWYKLILDLL